MNPSFLLLSILPFLFLLPPQAYATPETMPAEAFSVELTGENGRYYTGNVITGNNEMDMRMLVDSSSSDVWFASTWCTGPEAECGTRKFECTPAVGCNPTNPNSYLTRYGYKRMQICYDFPTGCINATVVTLNMQLKGGLKNVQESTVGMLNTSTGIFGENSKFDGMLGMGRPLNLFVFNMWYKQNIQTVFEDIIKQEELPQVFFVYLRSGKGTLDIGLPVVSHYQEPLRNYPGASPSLWMLLADKINFHSLEWMDQAIEFNTGWPFIGIPDEQYPDFLKVLKAKKFKETGEYVVACVHTGAKHPNLKLWIRGDEYSISPSLYVVPDPERKKKLCRLKLVPSHKDYWIFGIPWFEKYYTGFFFNENTLSIAPAK